MRIDKFFIIPFLILGAFIIYYPSLLDNNHKASIWISDEREFFKPIDVVWRGKIISIMAGGSCIGLKGEFDNYRQALACLPEVLLRGNSSELWELEGMVTVTGKWLGITCAYENTIFGKCVPDMVIENIGK
ncbi:MAG TPA: hypothetical protein VJC06_01570 [Candidatus Paceibacterota bacterium]